MVYKWSDKPKSLKFPPACPHCGFSIKLFRHGTGVQKVNQLFADELMMILRYDSKHPKLVLFSDSRQAAAKLSAGIELDHYRDSLRSAIMNSLGSHSEVKAFLEKMRTEEMKYKNFPDNIKSQVRADNYLDHIKTLINNELDGDATENEILELNDFFKSAGKSAVSNMSKLGKDYWIKIGKEAKLSDEAM